MKFPFGLPYFVDNMAAIDKTGAGRMDRLSLCQTPVAAGAY
jgi:hypothetical protein